ncbi:MAG: PaREP1 family protein [Dehalococcoidia bacterium]
MKVSRNACRRHGWAYKGWWEPFYRTMVGEVPENVTQADPRWASEKLWQDVEAALKAVAKAKGWPHDDERDLRQAIGQLYKETGDAEYLTLFSVAESLHMNFYEDFLTSDVVGLYAEDARRLVAKLQALAR